MAPQNSLRENAPVVIRPRLAALFGWSPYVEDPRHRLELHEMRISAKKLRYAMEAFRPCYGRWFAKALRQVREVQERIGSIHDLDVMLDRLHAHALARDSAASLQPVAADIAARRAAEHRAFVEYWHRLETNGFADRLMVRLAEPSVEANEERA
jgi:CHAD domain-containing protein